jgi:hypothetical protein
MIEIVQELRASIFQGSKKDGHRDLSATIDPNMEEVLLIELKSIQDQ